MIHEYNAKRFCKDDISKIENYDKAVADTTQTWDLHHRDEVKVLPSGMEVRRSKEELIENGRYWACPANELIFLTHSEHLRLHKQGVKGENHPRYGKHHSADTRKKMSDARKGEKCYLYGKHHSEETLKKISQATKGRKHRPFTEETKRRMSESAKRRWARQEHQ